MNICKILGILLCAVIILILTIPLTKQEYILMKEDSTMNEYRFYRALIISESEFIQNTMLANGALPMNSVRVTNKLLQNKFAALNLPEVNGIPSKIYTTWKHGKVIPYFSAIAIHGLLEAAPDTSRETVAKFINWYLNNLNTAETDRHGVDGTIYDYYVFVDLDNPSRIVQVSLYEAYRSKYIANPEANPHDYDSTDAYAAMFLRVLYEYYKTYGESDLFANRRVDIDRVLNALFSTFVDKFDLTYAKPNYPVFFLMDNCEVYNGLVAAAALYDKVFNDQKRSAELAEYAVKVKAAIERFMWNEEKGAYYYGLFVDGRPVDEITSEHLQQFYPHATAQLFPIIFGFLGDDVERATKIYNRFNSNFGQKGIAGKDWAAIDKGDIFPWAAIARAAVIMGDYVRADRFFETLRYKFIMRSHRFPYYTGEAGQVLIVINKMLTSVELIGEEYD